jgi:drug/metabolite transporter (DMT)-like permease
MRRAPSITILVCGIAVLVLGVLLVLGAGGTIDLRFAYTVPVVIGALGAVLLASGLTSRRRGRG